MRWEELGEQDCSIARALAAVGDRWTLLILRDCFIGFKRFDDFMEDLKLSRTILTDRLNKLVEHDVLVKVPYQEKPTRYDYKLTAKGKALQPVILALVQWGDQFYAEDGQPPILRTHKNCGQDFKAIHTCSECGDEIYPKDVTARRNPNYKHKIRDTRPARLKVSGV